VVISLAPHGQRLFIKETPAECGAIGPYDAYPTLLCTALIASGLNFAVFSLALNHGRLYLALFRRRYAGNNLR